MSTDFGLAPNTRWRTKNKSEARNKRSSKPDDETPLRSHCIFCADPIIRFDTDVPNLSDSDPDAMYCLLCEMWLNGIVQWVEHLAGKKHKKKCKWFRVMCATCISLEVYKDKVKMLPNGQNALDTKCSSSIHECLTEGIITSISGASAALEVVQRTVPPCHRNLLEDHRLSRHVRRIRKSRARPAGGHVQRLPKRTSEDSPALQSFHKGCWQCGFSGVPNKLRKCSGCYVARYCSRECQDKHWSLHKIECRNLAVSIDDVMAEACACSDSDDSGWTLVSDSDSDVISASDNELLA